MIFRVVIENYYGRLKLYWTILRNKFRDSHSNYDKMFDICCGLTNFLLKYSPLRAEDGEYYNALLKELQEQNISLQENKRKKMAEYKNKRKRNNSLSIISFRENFQ